MVRNAIFLALLTAVGTLTAQAAVIYESGSGPSISSCLSDKGATWEWGTYYHEAAESFALLPGANVISDVHWRGLCVTLDDPPLTDAFTIRIFADNNGLPAVDPMLEIPVTNVHRFESGATIDGRVEYTYWTEVSPVTLDPGVTYWISIRNDTSDFPFNWGWSTRFGPAEGSGASRYEDNDPWGPLFEAPDYCLVFQLTNDEVTIIPAPPALGLVLIGLAGMALRRLPSS